MAKKNTLFKVNIREENPLKTILKNGKIPVVRVNKTGFQNYKQDGYRKSRENLFKDDLILKKGCFVHLGGIRGTYVSGAHYNENINIGYIEPNTEVFSTYNFKEGTDDFSYIIAQERYNKMIKNYQEFFKTNLYSAEDFDIYAEAIVDAKSIVKVLTIEPQNSYLLLPFLKDEYLSFFNEETIFNLMFDYILKSFWTHLGFEIQEVKTDFNWLDKDLNSFWSYYYQYPFFKNLVLKEFVSFYIGNDFINSKEFYVNLKNSIKVWHNYILNMEKYPIVDINFSFTNKIDYVSIEYGSRYTSNYIPNKNAMKVCYSNTEKPVFEYTDIYYDATKNKKIFIKENELFFKENRKEWYQLLESVDYFKNLFDNFLKIEMPNGLKILKMYYDLENKLKDSNYEITNENIVIIKEESYIIEYNLTLLDAIITIPNDEIMYYNIENVPNYIKDDKFISYLEVLSNWKYL